MEKRDWNGYTHKTALGAAAAWLVVVDGQETPGLVVFELGDDGWSGVTALPPEHETYVKRVGVRLYRPKE